MGKWLRERCEWFFMCLLFWFLSWWPLDDDEDKDKKR